MSHFWTDAEIDFFTQGIPSLYTSHKQPPLLSSPPQQPTPQIKTILEPKAQPTYNPTLTFGKYKGQTYLDVLHSDMNYCWWCIECIAVNRHLRKPSMPNMVAFAEFCKNMLAKRV